jgi:16S rRNA (cytosine1402-N4)-methyltransferase
MAELTHCPVLLDECIQGLNIKPEGIYIDGTLGRAGHSREIAKRLTTGRLICIDRDQAALDAAQTRLAEYMERVTLVHDNFSHIPQVLDSLGLEKVDGVLLDLGVSSPQLDDPERGFSYMHDAPLDMRMDQTQSLTAETVVNQWPEQELSWIFSRYGEERYSRQVASAIVRAREKAPIHTTLELVDVIRSAMPAAALREKQHPAKRVFQAIRIAVNDELSACSQAVDNIIPRLNPGGRLCIITFHSLEDRLVKNGYQEHARGCTCPPEFPICVCGKTPAIRMVPKKPILPSNEEIKRNPRARSAKLRIAEKQ